MTWAVYTTESCELHMIESCTLSKQEELIQFNDVTTHNKRYRSLYTHTWCAHTHHSQQQHPLLQTLGCEHTPSLSHTHSYTPTTKYAHSKSAWLNKRWSCASQPNLWGGDSLPHRQGSAGASEGDTAGFQETNLFVYCLGVLSAVTVHCSQPILGMFF